MVFEDVDSLVALSALVHDSIVELDSIVFNRTTGELTFDARGLKRHGQRQKRREVPETCFRRITVNCVQKYMLFDGAKIGEFNIVKIQYDHNLRQICFRGGVDVQLTLVVSDLHIQVVEQLAW